MAMDRSSVQNACLPEAERSIIDRRRCPSPMRPSQYRPSSSGPRWAREFIIPPRTIGSTGKSKLSSPQIPHISARLFRQLAKNFRKTDQFVVQQILGENGAPRLLAEPQSQLLACKQLTPSAGNALGIAR